MTDASRSTSSLRDYLRVLKEQRYVVLLAIVVSVGVTVALSVRQERTYEAKASLIFRDVSQDLTLVGTASAPARSPDQIASLAAQTVITPRVLLDLKRTLRTRKSVSKLRDSLSASADPTSSLVVLRARAETASLAAQIANAAANQVVENKTASDRARFLSQAKALQRRAAVLGKVNPLVRAEYEERISRLLSLSAVAQPVGIAFPAEVPDSVISPKPVRDGAIALVLGVLLGLAMAFARDSLDRRLKGVHEIRHELDLPMIGHVREEVMGAATPASNGRRGFGPQDLEAFRILRRNVDLIGLDRPPRSVAVTSAVPDEGKSTVSAGLALACALSGRRTLLVECDLRRPSLAQRLNLSPGPGLSDYLSRDADRAEIVQTIAVDNRAHANGTAASAGREGRFDCIVAGRLPERPAELLASQRYSDFLTQAVEEYDQVILDTSPLLSVVDTLELLPAVEGIVVCVRDSKTTREQALAVKSSLGHFDRHPLGLVITGVRKGHAGDYGYYSYGYATEKD